MIQVKRCLKFSLLGFFLQYVSITIAAEATSLVQTTTETTDTEIVGLAEQWGLTLEEWRRYETIMKGPRGTMSPDIDPLTALGIEARTRQEQEHYALLYTEMFHERTLKEQRFQETLNRIRNQYYENVPVSTVPSNPESDSYLLFISARSCPEMCVHWLNRGMGFTNSTGSTLHIYLTEISTELEARQWALDWSIPPRMMYDGIVVLHIENGQHQQVASEINLDTFPILIASTEEGLREVSY